METKFIIGDRVHIDETRDSYEHNATIIAIRPDAARCIGVRFNDNDEYDRNIPWWYQPSELTLLKQEET